MAMDEEGHLIDPYGGFEDLKKGVLRHVSAAFEEDPLRVLRVSRFRAKLPWFRIAEETKAMLKRMVESGEVDALVPERVTAEIRKALKEAKPSIFFDELETNGFMGRVYPEWKQTELSRSLLDGLSSGFTEEEKFAASVASVDPNKLPALLEALRMPKKLTEFALLFSESLRDGFECASDGKGVLSVLRRKDALRRPERFAQLLRLLKEAHHIDSEKKWLMSAEAVRSLDFRSISAAAPDKSRVPELIEEASVRAIDKALDKFADQH
jgi:tRNA nucleotidyltransferase (CCA-adding enzyme)